MSKLQNMKEHHVKIKENETKTRGRTRRRIQSGQSGQMFFITQQFVFRIIKHPIFNWKIALIIKTIGFSPEFSRLKKSNYFFP